MPRIKPVETYATGCHFIQHGCFYEGMTVITDFIPAVVISHGKNRSVPAELANINSPDEYENADSNDLDVYRNYSQKPGHEFDDLVIWLSPNVLKNRMVTAGMLP